MVVLADHRRVEVGVAVDLRGAEKRDLHATRADPVVEHLRDRDDEVRALGELPVADRQRHAVRLGADRAGLVDKHELGIVHHAREDRGGARAPDADEAGPLADQAPRGDDRLHVAAHARAPFRTCSSIQARKTSRSRLIASQRR
jgi:hypothetical protein